jgi:Rrf2 family protein
MILSRTSQYAIQALIYMAVRPHGDIVLNRTIAQYLSVPPAYLAKIMQVLCRGNLVQSYRGPTGGFKLKEGAEHTDLMQILSLIEGPGLTDNCVLGLKICADDVPCPVHTQWKPIKEKIIQLLHQQTLEKLAAAVRSGKYRIADLPEAILPGGTDLPPR